MRNEVGDIIADLIDDGADKNHKKVNNAIGGICCDSKYGSLYIKGYNQKISNLRERIREIPDRLKLLEEANWRKEVIQGGLRRFWRASKSAH